MEWLVYTFLFMYVTWAMYLAVMNLIEAKKLDKMPLASKIFAYPLATFGIIMDLLLNIVVGTILFLDPPKFRHLLFTARLQEYIDDYMKTDESVKGLRKWRQDAALWICENLLDPFDPRGFHCRDPKEVRKDGTK
jgi:hypothetical protein